MAYHLQAFIIPTAYSNKLKDSYKNAVAVEIGEQLSLVPLTKELFNEINNYAGSKKIGCFASLTENMEIELLNHTDLIRFAYVEAEYFGGRGEQMAIIWEDNKRVYLSGPGKGKINKVLKSFGVIAEPGTDEFDMVGLGRYKRTERWPDHRE